MPTLDAPKVDAPLVDWALWWAGRGWLVFPLCSPDMDTHNHRGAVCEKDLGKAPMVAHGKDDGSADPEVIRKWWAKWPIANVGGRPPKDHFIVDIDGPTDVEFPATWEHHSSMTSEGYQKRHLLYRQNLTQTMDQHSKLWPNVDTRTHEKGYVVLPPSKHVSGRVYTLVSRVDPTPFPAEMIPAKGQAKRTVKSTGADSDVKRLLTLPRDHPDLGDDAMSKVAGYVARYIKDRDMYEALLGAVNLSLAEPLDPNAMTKKLGLWDKHHTNEEVKLAKAVNDAARGWLYEMGEAGYSTEVGSGDKLEYVAWSNFRVSAKSLMDYGDHQTWVVDFHKADGSVLADVELPSDVLASTPALRRFLVNRGMSLLAPNNDKRASHGERLLCLLQSQDYERHTVVDAYGWSKQLEAFVTPDKLIRAESIEETHNITGMKANLKLHYGFDDGAVEALREFLTFQDDTCMSLLGSWLMALFLKGQYTGLAPNLAVEAFSGSGKTTYVQLLSQLAGYNKRPGRLTYAVARNEFMLSHNIFCWHDDVSMDDRLQELFRAAATGGTYELTDMSKQDGSTRTIDLRASMVISAEHIKFLDQKAMTDRFIKIEFPTPTGRMSKLDPTKDQWHDVVMFMQKHGELTRYAGTLVQLALQHANLIELLPDLTLETSRYGQQVAILRMGARVLASILDDESHVARVDAWANSIEYTGAASYVTQTVAPTTWMNQHMPNSKGIATPIFLNPGDELFYINPERMAEHWQQSRRGNGTRDLELSTKEAIRTELKAMGVNLKSGKEGDGKRWKCVSDAGTVTWGTWYPVPRKYTEMIYRTATGSLRGTEED